MWRHLIQRLHQSWAFDIECHHHTAINLKAELKGFIEPFMSRSGPSGTNGLLILASEHQPCLLHHYHGSSNMLCSSPNRYIIHNNGATSDSNNYHREYDGAILNFGENIWAEIKNISQPRSSTAEMSLKSSKASGWEETHQPTSILLLFLMMCTLIILQ